MRTAWNEFRFSTYRWGIWVLIAITLFGQLSGYSNWNSSWTDASAAMSWTALLLAPTLGALAALNAAHRTEYGQQIQAQSAKRSWRLELALILPGLYCIAIINIISLIIATLGAWPTAHNGSGFLRLGLLLPAIGAELSVLAIGHIAGRIIGRIWLAPIVAISSIGLFTTLRFADGDTFFIVVLAQIDQRINPIAALLPLFVGLLLMIPAVFGYKPHRKSTGQPTFRWHLLVLGIAASGALIAGPAGNVQLFLPRPPLDVAPLCSRGTPSFCTFPEAPGTRDFAETHVLPRISALPTGMFVLREQYWQNNLTTTDGLGGTNDFGTFGAGNWEFSNTIAGTLIGDVRTECDYYTWPEKKADTYYSKVVILHEWLTHWIFQADRPKGLVTTDDGYLEGSNLREVYSWSDADQFAWANELLTEINACDQGAQ